MKTVSVINYKGGVGKTTLSANIAADLASRGNDVLLIDLDPQTNLTLSLIDLEEWQVYEKEKKTIKHWYDDFLDRNIDTSLKDLIISPNKINNYLINHYTNGRVDLICSHLELINVDMELSSKLGGSSEREIRNNYLRVLSRLSTKLNDFKKEYDYIIIDCPPNFNLVTQNGVIASDYYLIPAKPDYLSNIGINTLIRHIKALTEKYNNNVKESDNTDLRKISPCNLGVVFTMIANYSGKPFSKQNQSISSIKNDTQTLRNYVRENKTLFSIAPKNGIPVVLNVGKIHQEIRTELNNLVSEIIYSIEEHENSGGYYV